MDSNINGKVHTFNVAGHESAVDLIRDQARLTGTKLVCGAGVCGACTVLVDGVPITSCLLPAHAIEDKQVETIENYPADNLHPVQRAFMAHDGLQCGFCTPGFIMEGIAFYNRWQAENGKTAPSREQIAEALAGHLCRCGAYPGIYEAISRACAGEYDDKTSQDWPRIDALPKVTGEATYTVDVHYEGQLVGKILRSIHAHARVTALDLSKAKALPGVKAVVELLDSSREVRYFGQEIAAVAAVDEATARAALKEITVTYEALPAVFGIENALRPDAPVVYHERRKNPPNASEGPLLPSRWEGNLRKPWVNILSIRPGKARRNIEAAPQTHRVQNTWTTVAQIHTALEPHACVAHWESPQQLTVHLSTQSCHLMAHEIADHFDLEAHQVTVLCDYIGGAFGAKLGLTMEAVAAITLSRHAGAPVAVVLDRLEEMTVGGYRPAGKIEVGLAADEEKKLNGLRGHAYADAGIGVNSIIAFNMRAMYTGAPRDLADMDVTTHVASGKPFRAPGGPLACWALEQAVDQMAFQLQEDPIQLRRLWDKHELRLRLYKQASQLDMWRERQLPSEKTGRYRRGVGIAAANWNYYYHPDTHVMVQITTQGLSAFTASQDMGNGTRTVIARAVADVFGVSPLSVDVQIGNSSFVRGPLSGGSRTTNSVYYPAQKAAKIVRENALKAGVEQLNLKDARTVDGGIQHAGGFTPWEEIFGAITAQEATEQRGTDARIDLMAALPLGADDLALGKGNTGAVHVSEVEVDTLLGKVKVLRVWGGLAVGKIQVPELALSQCHGGVIQGIGYALYEEKVLDPNTGAVLSMNLEDYRIPGIGDIPEIDIYFDEEGFDHAKGSGVGLSELSTLSVSASIGNAVFNATGWRCYDLPIRPSRVVEGVRS